MPLSNPESDADFFRYVTLRDKDGNITHLGEGKDPDDDSEFLGIATGEIWKKLHPEEYPEPPALEEGK
jgi:hypothetical protein